MEDFPPFDQYFWNAVLDGDPTHREFSCESSTDTPCSSHEDFNSRTESYQSLTELDSLFLNYINGAYAGWDGSSPEPDDGDAQLPGLAQHSAIFIPEGDISETTPTPSISSAASTGSCMWYSSKCPAPTVLPLTKGQGTERELFSYRPAEITARQTVADTLAELLASHHAAGPSKIFLDIVSPDLMRRLVYLYFRTVNVLCPAIDENQFYDWYSFRHHHMRRFSSQQLLQLNAIACVALPHLKPYEITRAGFSSVPHGQKVLFELASKQYHCLPTLSLVERVRIALLLTHWSPFDRSEHTNNFWIAEAIRHAESAGLDKSREKKDRILWWCCVVRNRSIALALRRPYELRSTSGASMLTIDDFSFVEQRREQMAMEAQERLFAADLFVVLCKLSCIFESVMKTSARPVKWDQWKTEHRPDTLEADIENTVAVDRRYEEWQSELRAFARRHLIQECTGTLRAAFITVAIMAQSAKVALYIRHIYTNVNTQSSAVDWLLRTAARKKVQDASASVASLVTNLLSTVAIEEIPMQTPAWTILPAAGLLFEPLVIGRDGDEWSEMIGWRCITEFLNKLQSYYDGVKHVVALLEAIRSLEQRVGKRATGHHRDVHRCEMQALQHAVRMINASLGFGFRLQT